MAKPGEREVGSLKEFSEAIEEALKESKARNPKAKFIGNWYRGLGMANSHVLLPSLYRHPGMTDIKRLLELEASLLLEFNRQTVLHEGRRTYLEGNQGLESL